MAVDRKRKAVGIAIAFLFIFQTAAALGAGFSTNLDAIEKAAQSVVKLSTWDWDTGDYYTGSGFVAFDDKTLVTNYHVIDTADTIYAETDTGERFFVKTVIAADKDKDIALLEFSRSTGMKPLPLNDKGKLRRAETVVAIGSPQGVKNAVSLGNLGAVYEEKGVTYIQSTAQVTYGSSGGALFDNKGRVIGITSRIITESQGLNLAVHIAQVVALKEENWESERMTLAQFHKTQKVELSDFWNIPDWPELPEIPEEDLGPVKELKAEVNPFGITLSWNAEIIVEQFYIYRSESGEEDFVFCGTSDTGSYFDMKVERGKTYFYKIARVRDGESGELSEPVSAFMPKLP